MSFKTVKLDESSFNELIERQEGHFFDFKSSAIAPRELQKIAVAFANAEGGTCVVGIHDSKTGRIGKKRWDGLRNIEDFNDHIATINALSPNVQSTFVFLQLEGVPGYALDVSIPKSLQTAKTLSGECYQRESASSKKITDPDRIMQITYGKGSTSYEDIELENIDPELILDSKALAHFTKNSTLYIDSLTYLTNEYFLSYKNWNPIVASVLLYSDNPNALLPIRCGVRIARYTSKKAEPKREGLKQSSSVEGPIYDIARRAIEEVEKIISSMNIWRNGEMQRLKFPKEAIWEIISNAVIHRDYSISEDVQITIFDDGIEIRSPGRLAGHITLENLVEERFSRNTKIVRALARYKEPLNRDLGEGIDTTIQKMQEFQFQPPIFEHKDHYLVVTLPFDQLAAPEDLIMQFLSKNDEIKNRQVREMTGIGSENAVKRYFLRLRDQGLIEPVPGKKGSASAWRLAKK